MINIAKSLEEKKNYIESLAREIAKVIEDNAYHVATHTGMKVIEPLPYALGILEPRSTIEKSIFGFRLRRKRRALHIGTLWLDSDLIGAKRYENWVLEVYGKKNVQKLTELVKKLSEEKGVSFQVRLVDKRPRLETYFSDYLSYYYR